MKLCLLSVLLVATAVSVYAACDTNTPFECLQDQNCAYCPTTALSSIWGVKAMGAKGLCYTLVDTPENRGGIDASKYTEIPECRTRYPKFWITKADVTKALEEKPAPPEKAFTKPNVEKFFADITTSPNFLGITKDADDFFQNHRNAIIKNTGSNCGDRKSCAACLMGAPGGAWGWLGVSYDDRRCIWCPKIAVEGEGADAYTTPDSLGACVESDVDTTTGKPKDPKFHCFIPAGAIDKKTGDYEWTDKNRWIEAKKSGLTHHQAQDICLNVRVPHKARNPYKMQLAVIDAMSTLSDPQECLKLLMLVRRELIRVLFLRNIDAPFYSDTFADKTLQEAAKKAGKETVLSVLKELFKELAEGIDGVGLAIDVIEYVISLWDNFFNKGGEARSILFKDITYSKLAEVYMEVLEVVKTEGNVLKAARVLAKKILDSFPGLAGQIADISDKAINNIGTQTGLGITAIVTTALSGPAAPFVAIGFLVGGIVASKTAEKTADVARQNVLRVLNFYLFILEARLYDKLPNKDAAIRDFNEAQAAAVTKATQELEANKAKLKPTDVAGIKKADEAIAAAKKVVEDEFKAIKGLVMPWIENDHYGRATPCNLATFPDDTARGKHQNFGCPTGFYCDNGKKLFFVNDPAKKASSEGTCYPLIAQPVGMAKMPCMQNEDCITGFCKHNSMPIEDTNGKKGTITIDDQFRNPLDGAPIYHAEFTVDRRKASLIGHCEYMAPKTLAGVVPMVKTDMGQFDASLSAGPDFDFGVHPNSGGLKTIAHDSYAETIFSVQTYLADKKRELQIALKNKKIRVELDDTTPMLKPEQLENQLKLQRDNTLTPEKFTLENRKKADLERTKTILKHTPTTNPIKGGLDPKD